MGAYTSEKQGAKSVKRAGLIQFEGDERNVAGRGLNMVPGACSGDIARGDIDQTPSRYVISTEGYEAEARETTQTQRGASEGRRSRGHDPFWLDVRQSQRHENIGGQAVAGAGDFCPFARSTHGTLPSARHALGGT